jgi:Adenylate kinase
MSWGRRGDDESRRAHVIVGPPGSGKSTQAGRLAERLDLVHLSPGALFREMATEDSPLSHRIGDLLAHGELVPDAVTDRVLAERLKALPRRARICVGRLPTDRGPCRDSARGSGRTRSSRGPAPTRTAFIGAYSLMPTPVVTWSIPAAENRLRPACREVVVGSGCLVALLDEQPALASAAINACPRERVLAAQLASEQRDDNVAVLQRALDRHLAIVAPVVRLR